MRQAAAAGALLCLAGCAEAFTGGAWRAPCLGRQTSAAARRPAAPRMSSETKAEPKRGLAKTDSKGMPILEVDPEDTGLKVTPTAWKWPASWPYAGDYFDRESSEADPDFYRVASASLANAKVFDEEAERALQAHLERFIPSGAEVLEIGAGAHSYLPTGLARSRHAGVGISKQEMDANPALLEAPIEQDLNAHQDLDYADESFDVVLVTNAVEFFLEPRAVLREALRVLRPGGHCIVSFTGKDAYKPLRPKQIKMWRDMNDAQHMWVVGSFFHFSAGESWSDLKGYDITPTGSQGFMNQLGGGKSAVYAVQARKAVPPTDPAGRVRQWLRQCDGMEADELDLLALRLMADYNDAATPAEAEAVIEAASRTPVVYSVLNQLAKGVLYPPYKALLASRLVSDPRWTGSDVQCAAMKEGLGMTAVGEEFWAPLGRLSMQMLPEDKVLLLSEMIPLFGSPEGDKARSEFIPTLESAINTIKGMLPNAPPGDVQLLATELMITDYVPSESGRSGFISWLMDENPEDLQSWLDERKNYKEAAKAAHAAAEQTQERRSSEV